MTRTSTLILFTAEVRRDMAMAVSVLESRICVVALRSMWETSEGKRAEPTPNVTLSKDDQVSAATSTRWQLI